MHVILQKQFREIVENRLTELGWSRSELAREMHVGRGYVTSYLNAHQEPGPDVMERFFTALRLRPMLTAEPLPAESSKERRSGKKPLQAAG